MASPTIQRFGGIPDQQRVTFLVDQGTHPDLAAWLHEFPWGGRSAAIREVLANLLAEGKLPSPADAIAAARASSVVRTSQQASSSPANRPVQAVATSQELPKEPLAASIDTVIAQPLPHQASHSAADIGQAASSGQEALPPRRSGVFKRMAASLDA